MEIHLNIVRAEKRALLYPHLLLENKIFPKTMQHLQKICENFNKRKRRDRKRLYALRGRLKGKRKKWRNIRHLWRLRGWRNRKKKKDYWLGRKGLLKKERYNIFIISTSAIISILRATITN